MDYLSLLNSQYENSKHENNPKHSGEITREIVDYAYQKDAYKGHRTEGDYLVAYLIENTHTLHYLKDGKLVEEKPNKENAYIGIAVHRASDFRFIAKLSVTVTVIDENGHVIGKKEHLYHPRPELHHYGMNWKLPGDGRYTLRVRVDGLDLKWRGNSEDNFTPGIVEIEFPHVMIATGQ